MDFSLCWLNRQWYAHVKNLLEVTTERNVFLLVVEPKTTLFMLFMLFMFILNIALTRLENFVVKTLAENVHSLNLPVNGFLRIVVASNMALVALLILIIFIVALISFLYIPLPENLADRSRLQLLEMLLRLTNEYIADFVEYLFGARLRNRFTRFIVGLPYLFQARSPRWCTIKSVKISGVKCRVYLPDKSRRKSNGLLVFTHGGGWCIMRARYYDSVMYSLISRTGCAVVSIDYTLSPEVHFPNHILECQRVIEALYEGKYSYEYDFDKEKIALLGDSAGGNLVAVLCQRLLNEGKRNYVNCQILIYPVIHMLDFQSPSYQYYHQKYKGTALLNPTQLARFYLLYLGIEPTLKNIHDVTKNAHLSPKLKETKLKSLIDHSQLPETFFSDINYEKSTVSSYNAELAEKFQKFALDPNFSAIIGENLKGLPPAMILTCGIDLLRDEGFLYREK